MINREYDNTPAAFQVGQAPVSLTDRMKRIGMMFLAVPVMLVDGLLGAVSGRPGAARPPVRCYGGDGAAEAPDDSNLEPEYGVHNYPLE
ncbi:hypothetical protein KJ903_01220 [Patescibacteria group bacterium]|nr:hypothetical protein [Patescibacteria group bacterium]